MLVTNEFSSSLSKLNFLPLDNFQEQIKTQSNFQKPFVLILGSDEETRLLFKTALQIWNYDIAEAKDLMQSVQIIGSKNPDLVLMDTEFDLIESLKIMKSLQTYPQFQQSGFMLISGHAQNFVKQMALDVGATFFLVKPIDFELLEKSLKTFFGHNSKFEKSIIF